MSKRIIPFVQPINRLDRAEEIISEHEARPVKIIKTKTQRENRVKGKKTAEKKMEGS